MKLKFMAPAMAIAALSAALAPAAPLTIVNPSFESPVLAPVGVAGTIPGWQDGDQAGTAAGVFHPTTSRYPGGIPQGNNVAFSNGPFIFQVLSEPLTANSTYTLQVGVGDRNDTPFPPYTVQLRAGGNVLAQTSTPTPADGAFATATLSFSPGLSHTHLGKPLEVRVLSGAAQLNIDNVLLDATVLSSRTPVTVTNPGFEATVLGDGGFTSGTISGWSAPGAQGEFNPTAASGHPSEGSNIAYSNGGTISQVLAATLQAQTNYQLSVDIVDRLDISSTGYTVQLLAGGAVLAQDNSSLLPIPTNGDFLTSLLSVDIGATHSQLGQPLEIRLIGAAGGQTNFDNVRLSTLALPEPVSLIVWSLLGGLGLATSLRRWRS
jgi:hypothetical protein